MEPIFKLQLVFPDGTRSRVFAAGGGEEANLIAAVKAAVMAKGVGFWKTERHVAAAIEDGMTEALYAVKAESRKAL